MLIEFPPSGRALARSVQPFQWAECGLIGATRVGWEMTRWKSIGGIDDRYPCNWAFFLMSNNLWWFHSSLQHVLYLCILMQWKCIWKLLKWLYIGRICSGIWGTLRSPYSVGLPLKCALEIGIYRSQFSAGKEEGAFNLKAIVLFRGLA